MSENEPIRKICPLMTWRHVDEKANTQPYVFCYRDNCGLWDGKACSFTKISYLKDIAEALEVKNEFGE